MKNISVSCLGSIKFWGFPLLAWTLLAAASLLWNLYSLRQNTLKAFMYEAQTLAGVALSTIMWTAQHERVNVPLTEWIHPEPFFAQLPAREVVTTGGLRFAQVSHALISRQVAEQALLHGWEQKSIRMTSLEPLNPVNMPDKWERGALKSFKNGQKETFALTGEGAGALLKYMMPLRARPECLKCHLGYREGDILGGLSVSEPAVSRLAMVKPQIISMIATHAGIFFLVAVAMLFLLSRLRRQWLALDRSNNEQKKMIVKNTFRESDVVARIGGDEFAAIIAGAGENSGCAILARLRENLDLYNAGVIKPYRLSFSAGIVYCDPAETSCSIEALLKKADELMYESKRGKPHYCNGCNTGPSALEPA